MDKVECTYCGWVGKVEELETGESILEKWSVCPECGSSSRADYLQIIQV